jgi:hypothetical protein
MTIEFTRHEINVLLWGLRVIYGHSGDHLEITRELMKRLEEMLE